MHHGVLILDFGSQYTQLIARRIRELGVFSEIRPCTVSPSGVDLQSYGALVLSGGPASVTDKDAPSFNPEWLNTGLPTLGICYGLHLICYIRGAKLHSGTSREYGPADLIIKDDTDLFSGIGAGNRTRVWMSHGDHAEAAPRGFEVIATSTGAPIAAIANRAERIFALQFHPEVVHTSEGRLILSNFLFKIANLKPDWTPADFLETTVASIRSSVGVDSQAVCGISGGVDSTVAAAIVAKALGSRLHCLFVDNGLLRLNEAKAVYKNLTESGLGLNVKLIDARAQFLEALKGVTDPEEKRKVIGRVFIEVFEHEAKSIPGVTHLVQGTLYPDVIESVSVRGPSVVIKSHHNVGGLPARMNLKLIEPLRELFKDEVRRIGTALGVPSAFLKRQPFPGPGLAVRVLGELTETRLDIARHADDILLQEIKAAGWYDRLWQSFIVLLPVKSVGVMGDGRTYQETACVRAVTSDDGMTADWAYLPEDLLKKVSSRIINEVTGVNRVVLDISSKPPSTIEWE